MIIVCVCHQKEWIRETNTNRNNRKIDNQQEKKWLRLIGLIIVDSYTFRGQASRYKIELLLPF